ncbi:MAG: hypothetical protein QM208_06470 [Bacillota bacterium]|jgi:hypothetical protein|nr:hypothetical protein [Bacillota bacterium]
MTEQKILLAKHGSRSLFLFKRIYPKSVHTEYVIAYYKGSAKVGDEVKDWDHGHYFNDLKEAMKYFQNT